MLQQAELKAAELKFLMKLGNCEGYKSDVSLLNPTAKTPAAKRDSPAERRCQRICSSLAEKGFVEFDSEIYRFKISPPGRMLLTLQTTSLPVTPDELKLLKVCRGSMTAEKLGNCVPEGDRMRLIEELVERKLLQVVKYTIAEVRLTAKGQQLLQKQTIEKAE